MLKTFVRKSASGYLGCVGCFSTYSNTCLIKEMIWLEVGKIYHSNAKDALIDAEKIKKDKESLS